MTKVLVSGASSGLGKYLAEELDADTYCRNSELACGEYDVVVHNAWDTQRRDPCTFTYFTYAQALFNKLVCVPHKKFIFLSSVEVYPKDHKDHKEYDEDSALDNRDINGVYGITKFSIEQQLASHDNCVIIRPSSLLGEYTRSGNNVSKIRDGKTVRLNPFSILNFVLYEDILKFMQVAIEKDLKGIYNLISSNHLTVSTIHHGAFEEDNYLYKLSKICNKKVQEFVPELSRSSEETYKLWLQKY